MSSLGSARSDGDSWDLASSVGATATMVAASRALASREPNPLINDPFAEPLVRAVGHDFFVRLVDGQVQLGAGDSELTEQQMLEQIAVRTRFFDNFFADAGAAGLRQAVILASGLDARAYRLAWSAGTVVFEVDQPRVIEFKTATLAGLGAAPRADRRTVGIDLRDDWPAALRASGLDTGQPTAWIAEGLLAYLPPEAQDALLDHITALSAPGSRFAAEHIPDMGVFRGERAQAWQGRWQSQGLNLDVGDLVWAGERNHVTDYLASHGWRVTAHPAEELHLANGFEFPHDNKAMAIFRDVSYVSAEFSTASAD